MKLTLSILTLVLLIIIPAYVDAAPAFVQGNYTESVGTVATVSFKSAVTAGNLIVVVVSDGGVNSTFTCTRGGSNFTLDAHNEILGNGVNILSLPNATAGTASITCTSNKSTDQIRLMVMEFSGVTTSSPTVDTATNTGSGLPNAGPVTTTSGNNLLVFVGRSDSDNYHTQPNPASGWTLIDTWGTGYSPEPDKTAVEWRVATTSGNYSGSFTSVSCDYSAILVAYLPSGGVPPPPPPLKVPNPPEIIQVN